MNQANMASKVVKLVGKASHVARVVLLELFT